MYAQLSAEQKLFVDDLVRASVLDVILPNEVEKMTNDAIFKSIDDLRFKPEPTDATNLQANWQRLQEYKCFKSEVQKYLQEDKIIS